MAPLKLSVDCLSAIIPALIYMLIFTPIIIYFSWKFYLQRNHVVIEKRYGIITLYEVIFGLIEIFLRIVTDFVNYIQPNSYPNVALECIDGLFVSYVIICWNERFWHLYYDIQWTKAVIENQWKVIINPQHQLKQQEKFYIVHKTNYGSWEYTKKRILFPLPIIITIIGKTPITIAQCIKNEDYNDRDYIISYLFAWNMAIFTIPIISLLILYILLEKNRFHDNFFILKELRYLFLFLCIEHFAYTSAQYCKYIHFINQKQTYLIITESGLRFLSYSSLFVALLVCTCWVTNKLRDIVKNDAYSIRQIGRTVTVVSVNQSQSAMNESLSSSKSKYKKLAKYAKHTTDINLSILLSNKDGFELFMKHLAYELSTECLLGLVELIQFQQYIVNYMYNNGNDENIENDKQTQSLFQYIEFPDSIPHSFIVYDYIGEELQDSNNNNTNNIDERLMDDAIPNEKTMLNILKLRAHKLYKKYIESYCEYQVNLSYRKRKGIEKFMRNINNKDGDDEIDIESLLYLFDDACNGLYSLMKDSFRRFSKSPEFHKLQQHLLRKRTYE